MRIFEGEVIPVRPVVIDTRDIERRLFEYYTAVGVRADHGRIIRKGQIWRSNDPRRFRGIRVLGFDFTITSPMPCLVETIGITPPHSKTFISISSFTIGPRGWSLEKEAL